jgi:hypothetical protein
MAAISSTRLSLGARSMSDSDYQKFVALFDERLDDVQSREEEARDVHSAFSFAIAELFEDLSSVEFVFSDGKGGHEWGIDFWTSSDEEFEIYQCKMPEVSGTKPASWDKQVILEICQAVDFVLDVKGPHKAKREVRKVKNDYHRLKKLGKNPALRAVAAVHGELTPAAKQLFESKKRELKKKGVLLRVIEWRDIYDQISDFEPIEQKDIVCKLQLLDGEAGLIEKGNYCLGAFPAVDLVRTFSEYGWALFDWNVRLHVGRSPINRKIVDSLKTKTGRDRFFHCNNGVLITCDSFKIVRDEASKGECWLHIQGAQVVNGCQTVKSLTDAYDEELEIPDRQHFEKAVHVFGKVIRTNDQKYISDLVIATNNQNPMSPRNLKSNSSEQQRLQKQFAGLATPWFYQRKDGEWNALKSKPLGWGDLKRSDFVAKIDGKIMERLIDNERLAKDWYAFIGFSNKALQGGRDYFGDSNKSVYRNVFLKTPSQDYWPRFAEEDFQEPKQADFEDSEPSVYHLLLARMIGSLVDAKKPMKAREDSIERLRRKKKNRGAEPTDKAIADWLIKDEVFQAEMLVKNARELMIELIAMLLARSYGGLSIETVKKLLEKDWAKQWGTSGYSKNALIDGPELHPVTMAYAIVKEGLEQYYSSNAKRIRAEARIKTFLFKRTTVVEMRNALISLLDEGALQDLPWKPKKKTFGDALEGICE